MGTIVVLTIVAAVAALIIYSMWKDKKKGKSSCGCSCGCCANAQYCHQNTSDKKK